MLLRLRSDEQLLALFRAGSDEAFRHLHDRYRQRLFGYVRQMLTAGTRQDAEDVLQDVFVRAYGALRRDSRDVNVRAWLYRVAHNRCIDHLRRPVPPAAEIFELSRKPLHDPLEEAQRREDLRRLVEDVARLPDQQRSALLMREMDGMSYADLADALDVTVPAVKSLLVRARIGLVEAAEARDADCSEIRDDLLSAYDRGVKASARARKHMRTCSACGEYRVALRGVKRSFAALAPAGAGPLALLTQLVGLGGAGAGGAAGSGALAGGGAVATGGAAACKVAAVVCTAALAGGAVEVHEHRMHPAAIAAAHGRDSQERGSARAAATAAAARSATIDVALRTTAAPSAPTAGAESAAAHAAAREAATRRDAKARAHARERAQVEAPVTAPDQTGLVTGATDPPVAAATPEPTGGTEAPADPATTAPAGSVPDASPTPAATAAPTTSAPATTADTPAPATGDPGSTGGAVAPGP